MSMNIPLLDFCNHSEQSRFLENKVLVSSPHLKYSKEDTKLTKNLNSIEDELASNFLIFLTFSRESHIPLIDFLSAQLH